MAPQGTKAKPVRVRVKRLAIDQEGRTLVVLATPKRELPIWIGPAEGQAIGARMKGLKYPRPMTHDLFMDALGEVGWAIEKVVVSDLRETTFYGELHLKSGRKRKALDCRPSDGIALALRAKAPIEVAPHIFGQAVTPPLAAEPEPEKGAPEAKPVKRSARRSRRTSA